MSQVCSHIGCNRDSLIIQIKLASQIPNRTYIAVPSSAWIDDYFEWSLKDKCCQQFNNNGSFCTRDVPNEDFEWVWIEEPAPTSSANLTNTSVIDTNNNNHYHPNPDVYYDEYDYSYGDFHPLYDYDAPADFEDKPNGKKPSIQKQKVLDTTTTVPPPTLGGVRHLDDGWPDSIPSTPPTNEMSNVVNKQPASDKRIFISASIHESTTPSPKEEGKVRTKRSDVPGPPNVIRRRVKRKKEPVCSACSISAMPRNEFRPDPELFDQYLPMFLKDNPDKVCPKAGHAAYGQVCSL